VDSVLLVFSLVAIRAARILPRYTMFSSEGGMTA
jgi:hypothetical protein